MAHHYLVVGHGAVTGEVGLGVYVRATVVQEVKGCVVTRGERCSRVVEGVVVEVEEDVGLDAVAEVGVVPVAANNNVGGGVEAARDGRKGCPKGR